jgi:predicted transcriptional regulator
LETKSEVSIVTLEISSSPDVRRRALDAFKGRKQGARISFATPELLWKVLTAKRWELLKAMAGQGPLTIRETARRVGRDVKAVHGDVHALLDAGILDKTDSNRIVFPFDAVRVDFTLHAA